MIYEYECTTCHYEWEEERRLRDPITKVCPECEQETARRLISRTSFILNGPGWFKDGY